MMCSSSSSDLFCPSHPLFFPPPAPVLPPFAWLRFLCPDPPDPAENTCGVSFLLPSPASSLLGFVFLGWGCWGGGGQAQGAVSCLLEGEDARAVECGVEMQPRSKMCNKSGAGDPESQTPLRAQERSSRTTEHEPHHFDFPPLPVPTPFSLAGWWREELLHWGLWGQCVQEEGVYICTYTLSSTCIVIPTHGSCPHHRGGGQMYSIYFYMYYI